MIEQTLNEHDTVGNAFEPPSHDSSWHGRSSEEDITTPKQANNKLGRHSRDNSLRAGKTGKGSKNRASKKR